MADTEEFTPEGVGDFVANEAITMPEGTSLAQAESVAEKWGLAQIKNSVIEFWTGARKEGGSPALSAMVVMQNVIKEGVDNLANIPFEQSSQHTEGTANPPIWKDIQKTLQNGDATTALIVGIGWFGGVAATAVYDGFNTQTFHPFKSLVVGGGLGAAAAAYFEPSLRSVVGGAAVESFSKITG